MKKLFEIHYKEHTFNYSLNVLALNIKDAIRLFEKDKNRNSSSIIRIIVHEVDLESAK